MTRYQNCSLDPVLHHGPHRSGDRHGAARPEGGNRLPRLPGGFCVRLDLKVDHLPSTGRSLAVILLACVSLLQLEG